MRIPFLKIPFGLVGLGLLITGAPQTLLAETDPQAMLADIQAARLDPNGARRIENVRLNTGFADFHLEDGLLFPIQTPEGYVIEMIFVGQGRLMVEMEDDIESSQLELFTGNSVLHERFSEAVLVIALDTAAQALLDRPLEKNPPEDVIAKARSRFENWHSSGLRKVLGAETGMLLDRLGEAHYRGYFGAWFLGEELGELVLSVQPESTEQLTLGRFEPLDLKKKEARKLKKIFSRLHRKGRFLGLEVEELGIWDTWVSTSLSRAEKVQPGLTAFETKAYSLKTHLEPKKEFLKATARLTLVSQIEGAQTVGLQLPEDLLVDSIRDEKGQQLFYHRVNERIRVFLPTVPEGDLILEVDYHGKGLMGEGKAWMPVDNLAWYPRTGTVDRATYDLEFTWPKKWSLAASGELVKAEIRGKTSWQHRRLQSPGLGASFTLGKFKIAEFQEGTVKVTLALDDDLASQARDNMEEIGEAITSSLQYFGEIYGPYPRRELTVVSVPTGLSQSLPGFIHLSNLAMLDNWLISELFGLADRRTVIAHEVAHQWWGNAIGWKSYRDQWISEAMANYSALLWARRKAGDDVNLGRGPTWGWKSELTDTLKDGRPVESVGPLVLGERLSSSLADSAYHSIVYKKGAVVIDMLAGFWGEDTFVQILGEFTKIAADHVVSTEDFFAVLEKITGTSLGVFADRYVYQTGLPEVYYDYSFEDIGDGRHRVTLEADQEVPYRYHYTVVESPLGLDVRRTRVNQIADEVVPMVVPIQVRLDQSNSEKKKGRRKKSEEKIHTLHGRVALVEQHTRMEMEIEHKPKSLRLDEDAQVFGRFFNRHDQPKRIDFYQAIDTASEGHLNEARRLFQEVLTTSTPVPEDAKRSEVKANRARDQRTDWRVHLHLARLELNADRLTEARSHVVQAKALRPKDKAYKRQQKRYEAHLDLLSGDAKSAYRDLKRIIRQQGRRASTETWLLWAIASWKTGHLEDVKESLEAVENTGANVEVLQRMLDDR